MVAELLVLLAHALTIAVGFSARSQVTLSPHRRIRFKVLRNDFVRCETSSYVLSGRYSLSFRGEQIEAAYALGLKGEYN